jgi:Cof subfamily protein (haloacid dehalogenase superfamily)
MPDFLPSWDTHDVDSLREFARIRLVAVDLDGTLLRVPGGSVPPSIERLQRYRHIKLTVATGRALAGAENLADHLGIEKETPIVVYNGSLVVLRRVRRSLAIRYIPNEALKTIVEIGRHMQLAVLAYYCQSTGAWDRPSVDFNGLPIRWCAEMDDAGERDSVAVLIDVRANPTGAAELKSTLAQVEGISCTQSSSAFVEVRPIGSNKAAGLQCVAEFLGLSSNQVLALGDNDNDIEMLKWAGIGVVVAGSSAGATATSRFLCRHGVVSGVVEALDLVHQANRYYHLESPA